MWGSNPTPSSAWAAGPIKIPPGDLVVWYPTHRVVRKQTPCACRYVHSERRNSGEWPENQAGRIDGQSTRLLRKLRGIPAIAGFGYRAQSRRKGESKRGRVRNVRKSAKTRREWGESPQNQATRIDGQSVRIFRESRETQEIAGFGFPTHSQRKGGIKRRRVGNVRNSAKPRRERGEWPKNQATRIDGQSVRAIGKSRETCRSPDSVSGRILCERGRLSGGASEMYEIRRNRGASGANGANSPRIRRPVSTANRLGSSGNLEKPFDRRIRFPGAFSVKGGLSGCASGMYESRRKRGASGANGPRIRRPGSTASRLGPSCNREKSRRSPVSVDGRD